MQIPVTDTMGPNKLKCQSLEFISGPFKEMGSSFPKKPQVPLMVSAKHFYKKTDERWEWQGMY